MPLITTIPEIKNYLAIDGNTRIETLQPFINEAELLFVIPLLSQAFYDTLIADYDVNLGNMNAEHQKVMPYIQRALCYYMAYLSVNQMGVSVGDMGIQQQHGEDSSPAPLWKVEKLQLNYIQQADVHAEKLLQYLEINASVSKYNDWYASTANTKNEGYMVNNTRTANEHIDINESRRLFLRLKKRIISIETGYIKRLICADQHEDLVEQIKADSITPKNQLLIDHIRPIVAKMALYITLPSIRVAVSDQGLTLFSSSDGFSRKEIAPFIRKDELKALQNSLKADPFGYEADERELKEFIEANIADYPLIEASDCYTIKTDPGPTWQAENSADNKHFSV